MPLLILCFVLIISVGNAYAGTAAAVEEATDSTVEDKTDDSEDKTPVPDQESVKKVMQYMESAGLNPDAYILYGYGYYTISGKTTEEEESEDLPPSQQKKYGSKDFVIDDYDIYVRVNENNTLEITEKLNVWFNKEKHGIYRTIPVENEIERTDGTREKVHAKVTDISVNDSYKTSYEGDELKLQIGDPDVEIKGQKEYEISYTYNLGKDRLEGSDELYFNIVGTGWSTVIGHVSFTVEMPKSFDRSGISFASGWRHSGDDSEIEYKVNGNLITGEYNRLLLGGQAITIRIILPDGYFVGAGLGNKVFDIVMYVIPVVLLVISLLLWKRYGKDDMVVETVEFYPPDGLNSLQTAYLYKGTVSSPDVSSLLIYLADKGYLEIEESEEKVAFWKKRSFRIIKKRDYDGGIPEEEKFFKGLFCDAEEVNGETAVTSGQLIDKFYKTTNRIIQDVEKENEDKVFEPGTNGKALLIGLFTVISAFAIFAPPILAYSKPSRLALLILPVICYVILLTYLLHGKGRGHRKGNIRGKRSVIPGMVAAYLVMITGIFPLFALFPPVFEEPFYIVCTTIGLLCIAGMIICMVFMPRRTPYGIRMLGRVEGFRNFLVTAEKERLEEMVMSDPRYFYHILPYTYVLGVSDVWISKFEEIQLQDPGWCRMNYHDVHAFGVFMDHTMATADRAFTSSYSGGGIRGGGGFSGGGFSGGGFGGGGGGAW